MDAFIEWVAKLYEWIILFFIILIVYLSAKQIKLTRHLATFFTDKRYTLKSVVEIDPKTHSRKISLSMFNNNVSDARITKFGYIYLNKHIDFYGYHMKDDANGKLLIQSRDGVQFDVDINHLLDTVLSISHKKNKIYTLECFMVDSLGTTVKIKARNVRIMLKETLLQRTINAIEKDTSSSVKSKQELAEKNKAIRALKRQEFLGRIKNKFSKK